MLTTLLVLSWLLTLTECSPTRTSAHLRHSPVPTYKHTTSLADEEKHKNVSISSYDSHLSTLHSRRRFQIGGSQGECPKHNTEVKNDEGQLLQMDRYRWLGAWCAKGSLRAYYVSCLHTVWTHEYQEDRPNQMFRAECEEGTRCNAVPGAMINVLNNLSDDIECRPVDSGKQVPTRKSQTITRKPSPAHGMTVCSDTVRVPPEPVGSAKSTGSKRKRFVLTEEAVMDGGRLYKSPDLFIRDVTTPYHFRRSQVQNVSTLSTQLEVLGNGFRKIQFCMILAAGWGFSVRFHFEATEIA